MDKKKSFLIVRDEFLRRFQPVYRDIYFKFILPHKFFEFLIVKDAGIRRF